MMRFDVLSAYRTILLPKIDVTCLTPAAVMLLRNLCGGRIAFNPTMQSILAQFSERLWLLEHPADFCLRLRIPPSTEG